MRLHVRSGFSALLTRVQHAHLVEWDSDAVVPSGMEHVIFRLKVCHDVDTELLSLTVFTL